MLFLNRINIFKLSVFLACSSIVDITGKIISDIVGNINRSRLKNSNDSYPKNSRKAQSRRIYFNQEDPLSAQEIEQFLAMRKFQISPAECGISGPPLAERIVGGKTATQGAFPWIVSISDQYGPFCGGTIINSQWILTAAHCFNNFTGKKGVKIKIRVGSNFNNDGEKYGIARVVRHPEFKQETHYADIALMKTNKLIQLSDTVQPVCLPLITYSEPVKLFLQVAGWGDTVYRDRKKQVRLRSVNLPLIRPDECIKRFSDKPSITVFKSQICTWSEGKDACQGDSGGPLMEIVSEKTYLVGIVSTGIECAGEYPGIFTKVSFYLPWIRRIAVVKR